MITDIVNKIKSFSQQSYENFINELDFNKLTCSCGKVGVLIKHAYYTRKIKTSDGIVAINILRVICKCCNKTHAIFPQDIVPYSQILLNDHIDIIKTYNQKESFESIMMANEFLDESNIQYIIAQFIRYWKERLTAFNILIDTNIVYKCLHTFKRQFMQIKCVHNILLI